MIKTITREWEITKDYIFEVALRNGIVKLGWHDFEKMA